MIGDSGTRDDSARAVRNAYYNLTGSVYTDVWLMLGDNAYGTGGPPPLMDGADDTYQLAVFQNMYETLLQQTVLWPTRGNHELIYTDTADYYDIFSMPVNGEAGGTPSGTQAYYSFDFGNIHFICLESESYSSNNTMYTWLQADLDNTTQDWIIAYWHHPPYSKGGHNSDAEYNLIQMRERALPILETAGVDLVLSGHSHSIERSFLINGHYGYSGSFNTTMTMDGGNGQIGGNGAYHKSTDGKGAVYVVAGSSGKANGGSRQLNEPWDFFNHPVMLYEQMELGSVVIDISEDTLSYRFLRKDGSTPDFFILIKPITPLDSVAPLSPANLQIASATDHTISLIWDAPNPASDGDGASSYEVFRSPLVDPVYQGTVLAFTDSGLLANTTYQYQVYALDDAKNKSLSPASGTFSTKPDTISPQILSASALSESLVEIKFNEPLQASSVTQVSHYQLNPQELIQQVSLQADQISVILTLSTPLEEKLSYNLTVSNIEDLSGNMMTLDSLTLIYEGKIVITGLSPVDYQIDTFSTAGDKHYIDRTYFLTQLPPAVAGVQLILTKNNDKGITSENHLSFSINLAAEIWIGYDNSISSLPNWLTQGWENTSLNVLADHSPAASPTYNLYKKSFNAGQIVLGGNAAQGAGSEASTANHYIVFIKRGSGIVPLTRHEFSLKTELLQTSPNPFRTSLKIVLPEISNNTNVSIQIMDIRGHLVNQFLGNGHLLKKNYFTWNGLNERNQPLAAGLYFVVLKEGKIIKKIKPALMLK